HGTSLISYRFRTGRDRFVQLWRPPSFAAWGAFDRPHCTPGSVRATACAGLLRVHAPGLPAPPGSWVRRGTGTGSFLLQFWREEPRTFRNSLFCIPVEDPSGHTLSVRFLP